MVETELRVSPLYLETELTSEQLKRLLSLNQPQGLKDLSELLSDYAKKHPDYQEPKEGKSLQWYLVRYKLIILIEQ